MVDRDHGVFIDGPGDGYALVGDGDRGNVLAEVLSAGPTVGERDAQGSGESLGADEIDVNLHDTASFGRDDAEVKVHPVAGGGQVGLRALIGCVRASKKREQRDDERNARANRGQTLQPDGGRV